MGGSAKQQPRQRQQWPLWNQSPTWRRRGCSGPGTQALLFWESALPALKWAVTRGSLATISSPQAAGLGASLAQAGTVPPRPNGLSPQLPRNPHLSRRQPCPGGKGQAGALTQSPWAPSPATMLPPKCLSGLPPAPPPARPGGASPPPSEPSNSLLRAAPAFHALFLTSTRILLKCNSPHSVNQRLVLKTFGLKARLLSGVLQGLFLPENFFSVPQCVSFLLPSPLISPSVSASHHFLWAAFCGPGVRKGLLV